MVDCFKVVQTQTAEIRIPGGSTVSRFYFANLPNLRCRNLMALQTYNVANVPVAPSQLPLINAAVSDVAYLTLVTQDNVEIVKEIPYLELTSTAALGTGATLAFNNYFHLFNGQQIVWEKSYITLGSTAGIAAGDEVFLFNIYFK